MPESIPGTLISANSKTKPEDENYQGPTQDGLTSDARRLQASNTVIKRNPSVAPSVRA